MRSLLITLITEAVTILQGTTYPSEIVCKMHAAQLLQTLSLLTAEHTNSSVVG
jgi:hypothetical protein